MISSHVHSRPQRPRSFWSAPRIATSGQVQRHSGFEWLCKHNRLRPEPIRFVILDSEHARSDVVSVNRGLPVLDQARSFTAVKRLDTHVIYALPVTSCHFPVSSHKISMGNLLHSSHLGTKSNHSASTNVFFPSFTA